MKILYKTIQQLTLGGYYARISVETDGSLLYFKVSPKPITSSVYSGALTLTLNYNNTTKNIVWNLAEDAETTFTYKSSAKTVTISGVEITYKSVSYGTSHGFTWGGTYTDPDPTLNVTYPVGVHKDAAAILKWTVNDPRSRTYKVLGVNVCGKLNPDSSWFNEQQSTTSTSQFSFTPEKVSQFVAGNYIYFEVMLGFYASSGDDVEEYTGFAEIKTPVYLINSTKSLPCAPYYISITQPERGRPCTITWSDVTDQTREVTAYKLVYGKNGGSVSTVLLDDDDAKVTSYTFTIPSGIKTIKFGLRSLTEVSYSYSAYNLTPWFDVIGGNLYVGYGGKLVQASAVYLGKDGSIVSVDPTVHVG